MKYRFVKVDEEFVEKYSSFMVQMDHEAVSRGFLEKWNYANFISNLPGKWQLSGAVMCGDILVAYRIMSSRSLISDFAHSHRTCVQPAFRRKGVGSFLFSKCSVLARRCSYKGITLAIHRINIPSKAFYAQMGLKMLGYIKNGNELWGISFDGTEIDFEQHSVLKGK